MDSNTHSASRPVTASTSRSNEPVTGRSDPLAGLAAVLDDLAGQDPDRLTDAALAERVLELRRLLDRLEGHWLQHLAAIDARGAAGAEQDQPAASTASWLQGRLRLGAGAAHGAVRTARALFRGPLPATAQALTGGAISPAHARVLADGTRDLPDQVAVDAEPVLVEAAGRLDPPRLRRVLGHLQQVADPDGADAQAERRHARRGVWLSPTFEGMVAVDGLLEPEAGHIVLAALEPLARPTDAHDDRSGGQRTADALAELARRALEGGRLPRAGGVRPQLLVTVDLDSLLGRPGVVGGAAGWAGPLEREGCRRLACDSAVTRVVVTRNRTSDQHDHPGLHEHGQPDRDLGSGPGRSGEDQLASNPNPAEGLQGGCGRPWPCCHRSWAAPPASRWMWAGAPGSSSLPSAAPWRCATAAVCSRTASVPWPGARPTTCCIGWMGARPTWPIRRCCAGPITGPSMRAAGGWAAGPTASSPLAHPARPTAVTEPATRPIEDDIPPRPSRSEARMRLRVYGAHRTAGPGGRARPLSRPPSGAAPARPRAVADA